VNVGASPITPPDGGITQGESWEGEGKRTMSVITSSSKLEALTSSERASTGKCRRPRHAALSGQIDREFASRRFQPAGPGRTRLLRRSATNGLRPIHDDSTLDDADRRGNNRVDSGRTSCATRAGDGPDSGIRHDAAHQWRAHLSAAPD